MATARVGFIGPGRMGAPMIERLLLAGHDVTVQARRPQVAAKLLEEGCQVTATAADAATGAEIVVICVYTDAQVLEIGLDEGLVAAMAPGATLVIHTTGSPATAARLAEAGAPGGVGVVDAPVSGGAQAIRDGAITLLVGGEPDVVARVRPVLAAYGDPILHLGPLGRGQGVKLVNNIMLAAHVRVLHDGLRLAEDLGVDPTTLASALVHCSGTSFAVGSLAGAGSPAAMAAGLGPFLSKDVATVRRVVAELGADLGLLGRLAAEGLAQMELDAAST